MRPPRKTKLVRQSRKYLNTQENILTYARGTYKTSKFGKETIRNGVLIATNQRVLFFSKRPLGFYQDVLPYSRISNIESSNGFATATINIAIADQMVHVKRVSKNEARLFLTVVRDRLIQDVAERL